MVRAHTLSVLLVALAVLAPATGAAALSDHASDISPDARVEDPDGNVTVLRGSGSLYDSLDSPADVDAAEENGSLRTPQFLVPGDLLALRFRSSRVAETYASTDGANATDRFFRVLETSGTNFSVLNLYPGTEQLPSALALNRSNVRVLHAEGSDSFAVLVDTGNVDVVARSTGEPVRQSLDYQEFQAVVEVPTENGTRSLAGRSEFVGADADVETPASKNEIRAYSTPTVSPAEAENLTVTGRTPFLPNTTLTVRANWSGGEVTRTVRTVDANASDGGFGLTEFTATLLLAGVDRNATIEMTVSRGTDVLTRGPLLVGTPARMNDTTARLVTSGAHEGEVAVTATLRLPEPGLLVVYGDGGAVNAVAVPEHETVERTVYVDPNAVDPHGDIDAWVAWDRNENGEYDGDAEIAYSASGADAGGNLDTVVPVEGWEDRKTTTRSTTTRTTSTTGTSMMNTASTSTSGSSASGSTPGFGPGLAVVAVGAAALLAGRFRRG